MDKSIPEFKNEDEEREFWASHDSSEYVDWDKAARAIFPNLKLSKRHILSNRIVTKEEKK